MPEKNLKQLANYGQLVPFLTKNVVYESISGHPDIFMAMLDRQMVVAPNLPLFYKELLLKAGIRFIEGELPVGHKYPETAGYNVVYSENKLFHNLRYTDPQITRLLKDADLIHINQGYARCSMISLGNSRFITSDHGVERTLKSHGFIALYVEPSGIVLPGQRHGFIGGCCGIFKDTVFFSGSLNSIKDGDMIRQFCLESAYEVIELSEERLFDGGSILFVE